MSPTVLLQATSHRTSQDIEDDTLVPDVAWWDESVCNEPVPLLDVAADALNDLHHLEIKRAFHRLAALWEKNSAVTQACSRVAENLVVKFENTALLSAGSLNSIVLRRLTSGGLKQVLLNMYVHWDTERPFHPTYADSQLEAFGAHLEEDQKLRFMNALDQHRQHLRGSHGG